MSHLLACYRMYFLIFEVLVHHHKITFA